MLQGRVPASTVAMKALLPSFLLGVCAALPATAAAQASSATLASLRDHQRVLLVFDNGNNQQAEAQLNVAATHVADFHERDLVLAGIQGSDPAVPTVTLATGEDLAARQRFHISPNTFTVLLIGKDGGEKLRSHTAISWDKLKRTIDSMPMRQQEAHSR